jgi:hypothetical protein
VKGGDEILGGYNPITWDPNDAFGVTKDSFIFSFKNNDRIENYVLSRVINEENAIFNGRRSGPSFGESDLVIWSRTFNRYSNSNKKASYEKLIRETESLFSVEECEVFQIV